MIKDKTTQLRRSRLSAQIEHRRNFCQKWCGVLNVIIARMARK